MKYFVQDSHRLSQTKTWISNAICRGLFVFNNLWWLGVICFFYIRDRPFNLQGGYGFLFRSENFFRTTQELEYLFFFVAAKREICFQNLTVGYMTKTLNQIIIFFLHQNQNILLEKKTIVSTFVFVCFDFSWIRGSFCVWFSVGL